MSHAALVPMDPLGVNRGLIGLRAELRDVLLDVAEHHDCGDDEFPRDLDGYRVIAIDSHTLCQLLDELEAIVRRRGGA